MANELKRAPTKELKFNQVEISFIMKCLDVSSDVFWTGKTQRSFNADDIETMINIQTQILNTPYNESN